MPGSRDKAFYCQDNLTNTIYIVTIGWCWPASTPKNITLHCAVCHAHFILRYKNFLSFIVDIIGCSAQHLIQSKNYLCSGFIINKNFGSKKLIGVKRTNYSLKAISSLSN